MFQSLRCWRCWSSMAAVCSCLLLVSAGAQAQVPQGSQLPRPRLLALMPPGGQAGTTLEVAFQGSDLEEPEALLFTHPGIKAEPLVPPPPKPALDPKTQKPLPTPPPQPVTHFKVQIAPEVPPGVYEARLVNKWGISNSRLFAVSTSPEILEKEPNDDLDKAQKLTRGMVVNGVINGNLDVDYYVFSGKKGERVLIHCMAASLDSRLNPELRLLRATGQQVALVHPSPGEDGLLDVVLPEEGDYYLRLCQFAYLGGGPDYFYRLAFLAGPYLEFVWPPMIEPGKTTTVTLYGRNLPGGKLDPAVVSNGRPLEQLTASLTAEAQTPGRPGSGLSLPPHAALLDGFEYRLKTPAGVSNPVLVQLAQAPVLLEKENNDTPETAQEVQPPCEIAGKIDKPQDRDWYVFTAKKGEVYIIELWSHRFTEQTDMFVNLYQAGKGPPQLLANADDDPKSLSRYSFFTASRDPAPLRFVAPQDGRYYLQVGNHLDTLLGAGRARYRLRLRPEQPDFRLFVLPFDSYRPGAVVLGKGGVESFTVFAWRQDGFKGDIQLALEGLPPGVTCPPQTLAGTVARTSLVLQAAPTAPRFTGKVQVVGTAVIQGQKVVRAARPANVIWALQPGQNFPAAVRLEQDLWLAVRESSPPFLVHAPEKLTVSHGDKLVLPLKATRLWPEAKQPIQIQPQPQELPPNLGLPNVTIPANGTEVTLTTTVPNNVPFGVYNLVFHASSPVPFSKDPKAKQKPNLTAVFPSTPCRLTILPKSVVALGVTNANLPVKAGAQAELVVRVNRVNGYDGPLHLSLVLPPGVRGVSADPVTLPAGANETKLLVRVAPGEAPGPRPNLILRAVASLPDNLATLTHEIKITINVQK